MSEPYYNANGKLIPRAKLTHAQQRKKDQWYHPNPPVGATANVETVITPTWMHSMIHSMILINILMMLLIDRKDETWKDIVNTLKKQYNYLENGDIVTCGDEVLQFSQKFRFIVCVSLTTY